jgi:hypothetical protein
VRFIRLYRTQAQIYFGATDNLGSLRAQRLERILPTAFTYGMADAETQEPLKARLLAFLKSRELKLYS